MTTERFWTSNTVALTLPQSMTRLLRLDVSLLHDALPFLHLAFHEAAELARAHLHDLGAFPGELLLHLGRVLHRRDGAIQLVDDRLWRAGRRHDAPPVDRLVTGNAGLGDGGHVGQHRAAL